MTTRLHQLCIIYIHHWVLKWVKAGIFYILHGFNAPLRLYAEFRAGTEPAQSSLNLTMKHLHTLLKCYHASNHSM